MIPFLFPHPCPAQEGDALNNLVRQNGYLLRDHGHHVGEAKEIMKGFERQACEERGKVTAGETWEEERKVVG